MRDLQPWLDPEEYVFVKAEAWDDRAVAACREDEGLTLVLPRAAAPEGGFPCRRITLRTVTGLEEVGVLAWASARLAQAGIPCNPVAGFFHDHLFVPTQDAERALFLLNHTSPRSDL
ncbi:ACT domain-containing protein [soil metagenome]